MYTLDPHVDSIAQYLGDHPGSTAKQIVQHIQASDHPLGQAQVYNIIKRMLSHKILVKKQGVLSLNMKWITSLKRFSTTVTQRYQREVFLDDGEHRTYTATTLEQLNILRSDLSSTLLAEYTGPMYYFDPHAYHLIGEYDEEKSEIDKFTDSGSHIYYLFGSTSFLDQYATARLTSTGCTIRLTDTPPFDPTMIIASVGHYVYTVTLPQDITDYFEMFFSNTHSIEQLNRVLFRKVFTMKGQFTLTITKDRHYADKVANTIAAYFR